PLRERGKDIELITLHLIKLFTESLGKKIKGYEPDFLEVISHYSWPGNIRELQNAVEYAINVAEGDYLTAHDLPNGIHREPSIMQEVGKAVSLTEVEKITIVSTLDKFDGNITKTAKTLGIGRNTLYDKLRKWGIRE
ncbi:MAG TPA: sigma-54-dependent Fis family transcriptional regulator, partial [Desulfosporosinus sp.]|nr:sigma-54-dependent Fis family transcriptional regulator [Desulfosporosinus sp.]